VSSNQDHPDGDSRRAQEVTGVSLHLALSRIARPPVDPRQLLRLSPYRRTVENPIREQSGQLCLACQQTRLLRVERLGVDATGGLGQPRGDALLRQQLQ
jgi:hypothetical protein